MQIVVLKGQEISIGSRVRFVDEHNLYSGYSFVNKPTVGEVYTVRGFSEKNGFLLEELENELVFWTNDNGDIDGYSEPGFAVWRFEPAQPLRKKKIVKIEILPIVEERLEVITKV